MTIWFIEPRDPLIVRDGRPFDASPGAQATSLAFPFPSTTTGGVRTRAGLVDGIFDKSKIDVVKTIKVRGPLLVQLTQDETDFDPDKWLAPAPADALLFGEKEQVTCERLVPLQPFAESQTDFDQNNTGNLALVGMEVTNLHKPAKEVPQYWYWDQFQKWLIKPSDFSNQRELDTSTLGHNGPKREYRTHVSIDPEKGVARDGDLFGTSGMEFTHTGTTKEKHIDEFRQLALAVVVEENLDIKEGLTGFGGERRFVRWRKSASDLPQCPAKIEEAIVRDHACRVHLLTPACFKEGYRPTELEALRNGCKPTLKAIAIQRPQVVSGWDLATGKPKSTRRLAPAGSVFFLSLEGNDGAIKNWIKQIWMQCISDEETDRNDGFGLAVLGTWSGNLEQMQ